MSKNLKRVIAALLASLGIFAFAGCNTTDGGNGDSHGENNGATNGGSNGGGNEEESNGNGGSVIPSVPEGSVNITKAAGDLESAYVEWDKVQGATGYNVYCKADGGVYEKLDAPLVREYKDYFRADAVGLKAGNYSFKVVPCEIGRAHV